MIIESNLPALVSLARTPVQSSFVSSIQLPGTAPNFIRVRVLGNPSLGTTLTLTWATGTQTFTVLNAADQSGNTISRQTGPLASYAAQIAEELRGNYAAYLHFRIEYVEVSGSHFVQIEPREGQGDDIAVAQTISISAIEAEVISFTPPDDAVSPAVLVTLEVYDQQAEQYDAPIQLSQPILRSAEPVVFDLSEYLSAGLRYDLPPQAGIGQGGEYFTQLRKCWTKYRLRYTEERGRPPQRMGLASDGVVRYAVYGGATFQERYTPWWQGWRESGRFLTAQSRRREVTYEQPEWLYWIPRAVSVQMARIYVRTTRASGDTQDFERGSVTLRFGEIVCLKAGFTQLNLPLLADDPVVQYRVTLRVGSSDISEGMIYDIVPGCGGQDRYLLFGNSLGGCDTVRVTGRVATSVDVAAQQAQRIVSEEVVAAGDGAAYQYERMVQAVYDGEIGYRTASEIVYLQDLVQSLEVWMVDVARGLFSPVIIDQGEVRLVKDGDDLHTMKIKYRHAWRDDALGFTPNSQRIIVQETADQLLSVE